MVERKRFAGDGAQDYLGIGRNLLTQLKAAMRLNGLKVLTRTVDLPGGARITVGSMFGQDSVNILVPPELEAQVRAEMEAAAEAAARREPIMGQLFDQVKFTSSVRLTITGPLVNDPSLPPLPPYTGGGGIEGSTEQSFGLNDQVSARGSLTITLTTTTQAYVPPPPPALPSIYIAGYKSRTVLGTEQRSAFVWNDIDGMRDLGTNALESLASVAAISKNGNWAAGSVAVPAGYPAPPKLYKAARWSTDGQSGSGYRAGAPPAGANESFAVGIDGNGTTVAVKYDNPGGGAIGANVQQFDGKWDGSSNHNIQAGLVTPDSNNKTSYDGLVASGTKYSVDNGPWLTWGGSDCVALCVMRIRRAPYVPPPPQPPTITTTVLVFSG